MATDLDTIPWPGGDILRETAISRAKKAEQFAAGFSLARTKTVMGFNGKQILAETDWTELARLLTKLGINLDEGQEVAPLGEVATVTFQELPTPPAPVVAAPAPKESVLIPPPMMPITGVIPPPGSPPAQSLADLLASKLRNSGATFTRGY